MAATVTGTYPRALRETALRMLAGKLSQKAVARHLRVSQTTVSAWRRGSDPLTPALAPYRVDAQGERVSVAPGVLRFACSQCGYRAEVAEGHARCQVAA